MDRGHLRYRLAKFAGMRARLCLLCCGLALVLVGCDQPSAHSLSTAGPIPAVDSAQVLRMPLASGQDVNTLDPAIQLDPSVDGVLQLIWPTLVTLDRNELPRPWAAENIDISPDGLTYTFHLNPSIKFSDGTPVNAETFAYSLNRLLDPCTGSRLGFYLYALKDANKFNNEACTASGGGASAVSGPIQTLVNDAIFTPDTETLVLKLQQSAGYILTELGQIACAAVPQQLITRYGLGWTNHLKGFGANMYMVGTWTSGKQLTLERNPRFWGTKPKLRELDFTLGLGAKAAYAAYQGHQLDVGFAPAAKYAEASRTASFHVVGDLTEDYFAMNWHIAPFNDVGMRQAFALALNKQALVSQVFQGTAAPTNHIVPYGVPGFNAALTGPDGKPSLTGDTVKAEQLEQSYIHDACGGNVATCPPVTLTVASGYPEQAALANAALVMWKAAFPGYPISVAAVDYGTFLDDLVGNVTAPSLQFWATFWVADYPDPQDWLSEQFLPTSAYNSSGVNLTAVNALLVRADGESDLTDRALAYQQAEQLLVDQVAWIPLDQENIWWENAPYVQGFQLAATGGLSLDVWQNVFISRH